MSVIVKRDHPSGDYGLSVAAFPEDESVVVGLGSLRDPRFFALSISEARKVEDAIGSALTVAMAKPTVTER